MSRDARGWAGRRGAALVVALLILLAMTALGHGLLLLARRELAASRAGSALLRARLAAQSAVRALTSVPPTPRWDSVAVWGEVVGPAGRLDGTPWRSRLRRLSREWWLVLGWGGGVVEVGVARAAWGLDPVARVAGAQAVATVGPGSSVAVAGTVEARGFMAQPEGLPLAACDAWRAALDSLLEAGMPAPVVAVGEWMGGNAGPDLGRLDQGTLARRLPAGVAGAGTPKPAAERGSCLTADPWNWGDPRGPPAPCGTHLPARAVKGDVTLEGGVGQGLLSVSGDLFFRDGARFHGVVLVGGRLSLEGDARLEGLARVAGDLHVGPGARIDGSACRAVRALAAARAWIGAPISDTGTGWISLR